MPSVNRLDEDNFLERLEKREMAAVKRVDNDALAANVPPYLIRPASFRMKEQFNAIALGQNNRFWRSILQQQTSEYITYSATRARSRSRLWGHIRSSSRYFFELITGQPPFDVSMLAPQILVQQMMDFATDDLPLRWRAKWEEMREGLPEEDDSIELEEWLSEVYSDSEKEDEFTSQDMTTATRLIGRMLKFEPSFRATPSEILEDIWWSKI
ncbi:hypothetical protein NW762_010472 [Fusarium torreyae]|uniref:Protein kinase domain-containing protein n=1 Tax=Fusarium torreyae TaxID=1237075 RepID=A0A9W8VBE9_9HYPO|nr:hypothetical protein NW762_010472 [Fusarium torreyae]